MQYTNTPTHALNNHDLKQLPPEPQSPRHCLRRTSTCVRHERGLPSVGLTPCLFSLSFICTASFAVALICFFFPCFCPCHTKPFQHLALLSLLAWFMSLYVFRTEVMDSAGSVLRIKLCWSVCCLELRLRVISKPPLILAVKPWSDPLLAMREAVRT